MYSPIRSCLRQGLLIRARLKPQSCGHFLRLGGKCKQTYASTGSYNPATVTVWVTLGGRLFMFTPQTQKVYRTATNLRFQPSSIHKPCLYLHFDKDQPPKNDVPNQKKKHFKHFFTNLHNLYTAHCSICTFLVGTCMAVNCQDLPDQIIGYLPNRPSYIPVFS